MTAQREAAIETLIYMTRAWLAAPAASRQPAVGPGAKPWCDLVERCTRCMDRWLRPVVVPVLARMIERAQDMTPEQLGLAGSASRRLLAFGWRQAVRDGGLVRVGIEGVCRTFESDPAASAALVRQALQPDHLAEFGHEEMPTIAGELTRLIPLDPALVEDVYRAAFAFTEERDAPTSIGDSNIMPLRSNRRQDYRLAVHTLADDVYGPFLAAAPENATAALLAAVEGYVGAKTTISLDDLETETFTVGEVTARLAEDHSHIWDARGRHHQDDVHRVLDAFERRLRELEGPAGEATRARMVALVIRRNRFAAVWRRLLACAADAPATLGRQLVPLAWSIPVLTSTDTSEPAGTFLRAIFPLLSQEERERAERAVLGVPAAFGEEVRGAAERVRDRLLGCLPLADLVTEEARLRVLELAASGGPPPNDPPFEIGEPVCEAYTEVDHLADQGVPVEENANRRLQERAAPAQSFAQRHLNDDPGEEAARAVLGHLRALRDALARPEDGGHPLQRDAAWTHLAGACAAIARGDWLERDVEIAAFVRDVLLDAAVHERPRFHAEQEEQFDRSGILSTSPRFYAAIGLCEIARIPACASENVIRAVGRLARDPVASVRLEVVRNLTCLYRTAPETMWEVLTETCRAENRHRVLRKALLAARQLARAHPDRVAPLVRDLFGRLCGVADAEEVRCDCLSVCLILHEREEEPYGGPLVSRVLSDITGFPTESVFLVVRAAERLTCGAAGQPDLRADRLRRRSFDLLERIARETLDRVRALEAPRQGAAGAPWSEEDRRAAAALRRIAHDLGRRVYFASRAFEERNPTLAAGRPALGEPEKRRLLGEGATLFDLLADLAFPDVVHSLLETLASLVPVDPRAVLLRVARAVQRGQREAYEHESMGADLVVRLTQRYLAEHRPLFRDDQECRDALIAILNTFIRAGWPAAMALSFRLEEIYR